VVYNLIQLVLVVLNWSDSEYVIRSRSGRSQLGTTLELICYPRVPSMAYSSPEVLGTGTRKLLLRRGGLK
jgi:hypothetical protein